MVVHRSEIPFLLEAAAAGSGRFGMSGSIMAGAHTRSSPRAERRASSAATMPNVAEAAAAGSIREGGGGRGVESHTDSRAASVASGVFAGVVAVETADALEEDEADSDSSSTDDSEVEV